MNFIEIKIKGETVFTKDTDCYYNEYILATIEAIDFLSNIRKEYLKEVRRQLILGAEETGEPVEDIPIELCKIIIA